MNVLSKMIDETAVQRKIGYHLRCQIIPITHPCFADNIMIFVDGQQRYREGVLSVFKEFAKISGLRISLEKSTLYMEGISQEAQNSILTDFPFSAGQLPVRYLGLPVLTKRMTVNNYLPLMEKIQT